MFNPNIYREAAKILRTYGWKQRGVGVPGAPQCALGAIWTALGWSVSSTDSFHSVHQYCDALADYVEAPQRFHIRIGYWNDAPGRQAQEVIDALESFADALEAQHEADLVVEKELVHA